MLISFTPGTRRIEPKAIFTFSPFKVTLFFFDNLSRFLSLGGHFSLWTTENPGKFIHIFKCLFLLSFNRFHNPNNLNWFIMIPPVDSNDVVFQTSPPKTKYHKSKKVFLIWLINNTQELTDSLQIEKKMNIFWFFLERRKMGDNLTFRNFYNLMKI